MAASRLEFAWQTHRGRVRAHNEDAVAVEPDSGLVVVADGIGGASAGEVASRLATQTITQRFRGKTRPPADKKEALRRAEAAIDAANRAIWEEAFRTPGYAGMGTTVVMGYARGEWLAFAHVGDSRLYRLRQGQLLQLTRDHSLIQEVVDQGFFRDIEQARRYGIAENILTRGLGSADPVRVDCDDADLMAGDIYLFCTDGLTNMVNDERIRDMLLAEGDDLEHLAQSLIDAACTCGGLDNITVALMRVGP